MKETHLPVIEIPDTNIETFKGFDTSLMIFSIKYLSSSRLFISEQGQIDGEIGFGSLPIG